MGFDRSGMEGDSWYGEKYLRAWDLDIDIGIRARRPMLPRLPIE